MSNKTSDINVANIEDDVKIVKEFINYAQGIIDDMEYERPVDVTVYQKDLTSMANILDVTKVINKSYEEFMSNYIAKQVIIDKVNEINKKYEDSKDENGESPYFYPDFTIRILQKLLEGEK